MAWVGQVSIGRRMSAGAARVQLHTSTQRVGQVPSLRTPRGRVNIHGRAGAARGSRVYRSFAYPFRYLW